MSDPANIALDSVHCRAICDEIGDRLRFMLRSEFADTPPYLRVLLNRFQLLELQESPSIAPSLYELSDADDVRQTADA